MIRAILSAVVAFTALVGATGESRAQIPDEFTNLKVLPEDIGKRELLGVMRGFAGDLGVRCNHCHVGPDNLQGMDFATDEKQTKKVSRKMMKMVDSINGQHLAKIDTGRDARVEVTCQTCHHGVGVPQSIDGLLARSIDADGIDAATKLYRELREKHYGEGAYDFSRGPLNGLAELLGGSDKLDEALAIVEMNIEFHPEDSYTRMMAGGIHQARGENAEAIAAFEKAVAIEPENRWAKQQLERVKAAAQGE